MSPRDLHTVTSAATTLRERVLDLAERMRAAGHGAAADEARALLDAWWSEHEERERRLARLPELHHEINNALVGVRGHAQLMLHGDVAADPRTRERLDVILRESARIEKAALQVRAVLGRFGGGDVATRAT